MELKGIKINFLGDSITEGVGASDEGHRFTDILQRRFGLAEARNYGISGTRYARQAQPSDDPRCDRDFCSRVCEMDADADIVIVFGGTNDFGHGDAPLGTFSDRTSDTFCGACHLLYTRLIERYPAALIVILTPLHRENEDDSRGDGNKALPAAPLRTYVEIIRQAAEYYSLPVLDLFAQSGLQPKVPVIKQRCCPDGLHPNDTGHEILASKIGAFLLRQ
jgi:lysophospholipase L1-like esterase